MRGHRPWRKCNSWRNCAGLSSPRSPSRIMGRVSRDIIQQTEKVNGMQAVKFVALAKRTQGNVHIHTLHCIETVKEMDRWIKGNQGGKGAERERLNVRGKHETGEGKQCGRCLHSVYRPGNYPQCLMLSRSLFLFLSPSLSRPRSLFRPRETPSTSITYHDTELWATADRHANSSRTTKRNSGRTQHSTRGAQMHMPAPRVVQRASF